MKKTPRSLFGQPTLRPTNYNTTEPYEEVDLSTKVCMQIDGGLSVDFGCMLAKSFGKVYYHVPNTDTFPKLNIDLIGYGMEGLILCNDIWEVIDEVDIFIFTWIGMGGFQEYLIKQGKRVWGMRRGEDLELLRFQTKVWMDSNGLDVNETTKIIGISELRKYFESHEDVYVKISKYRGQFETFHHANIFTSETWLDETARELGAFKEECEFLVEVPIETKVEAGFDGYVVDGQYPKIQICGFEVKDKGYVCRIGDPPEVVTEINELFKPIISDYGCRGNFSNEIRLTPDRNFMCDMTMRLPSPPAELYQNMISNWAEIAWHGSMGNFIEPIYTAKYGALIMVESMWIDKHWMTIKFPPKFRENVKLSFCCKIDGNYHIIPQDMELTNFCAVIGTGDTLEEAIEQAKEVAGSLQAYDLKAHCGALDEAEEVIEKAKELGIKF
jgi:hypothetical protein